jgi:predicted deacylase
LRFDEFSIRAGMKGILNVLQHLGMTRKISLAKKKKTVPFIANGSQWIRANASGIVHNIVNLGDQITKGQVLAEIGSPYGAILDSVKATRSGILIGKQNIPLVQEGEAMFHIAYFSEDDEEIADHIENVQEQLLPENNDD